MSELTPPWQCHVDALVLHPVELRVMLVGGQAGWVLPSIDVSAPTGDAIFPELQPTFERELGLVLTVLRRVSAQFDEATRQATQMLVMELQRPVDALPVDARWVDLESIMQLSLAHPEQRELIMAFLREAAAGEVPVLRPPWALPGWYAQASAWIADQVTRLGYELHPPIVQVRTWCLSAVLRVSTSAGSLYFKVAAPLPLFADEPAVMIGLAALFPNHVPAPVAVDQAQRWMLLPDLGRSFREQATIAARHAMLHAFGQLQRAAVAHVPQLLAIGCLDRRLDTLATQIAPLLADADALGELTEAEVEQLRLHLPRLTAMCAALADYRVPQTLVHGDLNLGNVALHAGLYHFIDWTDACVSHPFFDLISILWEEDAAVRTELLTGYLTLWTDYEPLERLWDAWRLAEPLCCLHQAISYQYILANVEASPEEEFAGAVAEWVRRILVALAG